MSTLIDTTFGALMLGGFCSAALSGAVAVQTFLYIKLFPQDSTRVKTMVGVVWALDTVHSLLVYASIWISLITNYGNEGEIDHISVPLALTVEVTAVLTFIVHCFFARRIYKLSRHRWQFATLVVVIAFFRLFSASVTTAEMIHMKTFTAFKAQFRWVFTLGLSLSCLVDLLITGFLTHSLHVLQSDKASPTSLDRIISAAVVYTFETNILTSAATVVSMICWLTMQHNLIFMGLHFFISKLYANSLLATLNTREELRHQRQRNASADLPRFASLPRRSIGMFAPRNERSTPKLEVTVEETVEFGDDDPRSIRSLKRMSITEPPPI